MRPCVGKESGSAAQVSDREIVDDGVRIVEVEAVAEVICVGGEGGGQRQQACRQKGGVTPEGHLDQLHAQMLAGTGRRGDRYPRWNH